MTLSLFIQLFTWGIIGITTLLIIQSLFTIFTMIYTWNDPNAYERNKTPETFLPPYFSFSAIVAARNEARVIQDTVKAIHAINYPDHLKELIIVCREDDSPTVNAVKKIIKQLDHPNITLLVHPGDLKNKPMSLNVGLHHAVNDVIVVFDAEDEPNQDIYQAINTTFITKKTDVVQAGVQLMDFRSSWYATLNVLEYYFWFKSALHFFANVGAVPLGGNTVFFKRHLLEKIGGWNESLLTEDADIGIRLSISGAKMSIMYDEKHVTQEETPHTLKSFIKQRTRWQQGFLQILFSGSWFQLPDLAQKVLIGYLLFTPLLQALWLLYLPMSILIMLVIKLPIVTTLYAFIPFYLLSFQYVLYTTALYLFTRDYKMSFPLWMPLKVLVTLYPYQVILGWSSLQATRRLLKNNHVWEKTEHTNAHRAPAFVESI